MVEWNCRWITRNIKCLFIYDTYMMSTIALLGTRPIWNFFQIKTQEIYNKKKCQVGYKNLTLGIEVLNRRNPWMDPLSASLQWLSCNVLVMCLSDCKSHETLMSQSRIEKMVLRMPLGFCPHKLWKNLKL